MICCCNVGLRIYDSVGGGSGDVSDYDGCNVCCGDAIIIFVGWLAAAAMQQPTAIRNKASTHALDVNRMVKSVAVIA